MSRPRREWWSCLCSRRCSVRWVIRRVSRETCTSVAPVSSSDFPKRWTISCFSSAVNAGMRAFTVAAAPSAGRTSSRHVLGDLDVVAHLLDQRLGRVEALLAADALHERQPQLLVVAVAVVADQE